jgi:tetratricopeptide (TPR) repeat protein
VGQVPKAIREYRQAVTLDPHQADAFFNLATLLEKTDPAEARSCYQEVTRINPRDETACYRLGLLCESDNPAVAAGHYRQALKINPGFLPAQTRLQQLLKQRPSGIPD